MSLFNSNRRTFLKIFLSVPAAYITGCFSGSKYKSQTPTSTSPKESLAKLVMVLGPWTPGNKEQARSFADRFMNSESAVAPYLPSSGGALQSLANRFPDDALGVKEIDLKDLPEEERQLLMTLTKQIYTYVEIRFLISGEPQWGNCQSDISGYTQAPA